MASLSRAGLKLKVIPWRAGFERLSPVAVDYPSAELQPINLVHLNLDFLFSGDLNNPPLDDIVTPDHYNILIPYWELASVPVEWTGVIRRFDEVWCASSFMARSLATIAKGPVRVVRPAIEFPGGGGRKTRCDFELPEDRFIFFCAADTGSILARKNPKALVEAYIEEFAPSEGACCVVKIIYSDPNQPDIGDIVSIARLRTDVIFMERQLDEQSMFDLYGLIDCYVSPHRSEGLGLTLLEAMNAGKPVIATAYGGVADFVNQDVAYPIDYRLVKVGKDRLPYPEQFTWADPLQSSLRSAMRFVYRNRDETISVGLKGHAHMRSMFSLDRTAAEIRAEISRIWNGGQNR
jgi:glycosyltransferase involved in cell wall biosynthesis